MSLTRKAQCFPLCHAGTSTLSYVFTAIACCSCFRCRARNINDPPKMYIYKIIYLHTKGYCASRSPVRPRRNTPSGSRCSREESTRTALPSGDRRLHGETGDGQFGNGMVDRATPKSPWPAESNVLKARIVGMARKGGDEVIASQSSMSASAEPQWRVHLASCVRHDVLEIPGEHGDTAAVRRPRSWRAEVAADVVLQMPHGRCRRATDVIPEHPGMLSPSSSSTRTNPQIQRKKGMPASRHGGSDRRRAWARLSMSPYRCQGEFAAEGRSDAVRRTTRNKALPGSHTSLRSRSMLLLHFPNGDISNTTWDFSMEGSRAEPGVPLAGLQAK